MLGHFCTVHFVLGWSVGLGKHFTKYVCPAGGKETGELGFFGGKGEFWRVHAGLAGARVSHYERGRTRSGLP